MRRKRFIATIAAGLGVIALVPVATALGDDSGDSKPFGQTIEAATALGSSFTYQGRLTDGGSPANGNYDLRFILYDADTAGAAVGSTQTKDDVSVTNGLFSVELDFGNAAWNGDARWVEISVRPGASSGTYTVLSPRQPVSPTPYALFAKAAAGFVLPFDATGTSAGAPSTPEGLITVTQTGTGIGIAANRTTTDAAVYPALLGTNSGGGAGVQGESTFASGIGVQGFAIGANGTAVSGTAIGANTTGGSFSGATALQLDGPVKVTGSRPTAFVHTATAPSKVVASCPSNHCSFIDNALLNGDPAALVFITQRFNEGESTSGVYNTVPVGVWYEPTLDKWVIFNEDQSAMPTGAKFNVLVIKQ